MEVEFFITNKIPDLDGSAPIVFGSMVIGGFGHFSIKFVRLLARTKFCFCSARKTVLTSSLGVSGFSIESFINLSFKSCSTVNSVIGAGIPEYGFPFFVVIVLRS